MQEPGPGGVRTARAESVSQLRGEKAGFRGSEAEMESSFCGNHVPPTPTRAVVCRSQTQIQGKKLRHLMTRPLVEMIASIFFTCFEGCLQLFSSSTFTEIFIQ